MKNLKADEVGNRKWWRWGRYLIVNGSIVPDTESGIQQYDPWLSFAQNEGGYRTVDQPYLDLLELGRSLAALRGSGIDVSSFRNTSPTTGPQTRSDELILAWCNKHGLLGLVPVLSSSMSLPPVAVVNGQRYQSTQTQYTRAFGEWHTVQNSRSGLDTTGGLTEQGIRRKVEQDIAPYVNWLCWQIQSFERRDLMESLFRYSSSAVRGGAFKFGQPGTTEFWREYAEPLSEVGSWSEEFADSARTISRWDKKLVHDKGKLQALSSAHARLSGLAREVSPAIHFYPDKNWLEEKRVSPGLIASYALMFLWDRMADRRALNCEVCGTYFISNDEQARYCRKECRNTASVATKRKRKALALKMAAAGITPAKIAQDLGGKTTGSIVKRWIKGGSMKAKTKE